MQWVQFSIRFDYIYFLIIKPLVLHPQHKSDYFRRAGWSSDWIDTAESLVRDEFERSYKDKGAGDLDMNEDKDLSRSGLESDNDKQVCLTY